MRPGEFNRYLDAEQQRAALLGRQWHAQRRVDIAMNGADERDATDQPVTLLTLLHGRIVAPFSLYRGFEVLLGPYRVSNLRSGFNPCDPRVLIQL